MGKDKGTRENFLAPVKRVVAQRSGYRCNMPHCDRITIGPGHEENDTESIGTASHIYSAAPNGPRGRGGLTGEEIRSIANAIWMCEVHGKLVDVKKGNKYPAPLLLSYKALHEAKISRELEGIYDKVGWFDTLQITSSPIFLEKYTIQFSKLTLFIGDNGTGKSAICEWLAGISSTSHLNRWWPNSDGSTHVEISLNYLNPEKQMAGFSFATRGFPSHYNNEYSTIASAIPIKIVYPKKVKRHMLNNENDDIEFIAQSLNTDKSTIFAIAEEIASKGTGNVTNAKFREHEEEWCLYIDVKGAPKGSSLRALSSGESSLVLMEFAIIVAKTFSKNYPTILIMDAFLGYLDTTWLQLYGEYFSSSSVAFQTIATMPTQSIDLSEVQWSGWRVINLNGVPPNVTITSGVREKETSSNPQ